jgi:hypothetical protein
MGFKSVLEITDAPEAYSTTISFRFGPAEAVRAVGELIREGLIDSVERAPVTRFPWPVDNEPKRWKELRECGMNTAFRFPLLDNKAKGKREGLAAALRNLPVTSLVFLKHLGRVEVSIRTSDLSQSFAWTVVRSRITNFGSESVTEFSASGTYRVELKPDQGESDTFLVAYEPQIEIASHRGGLDEVSWDGVTITEVSVAARMRDDHPIALDPLWRKLHVFLPTGEPCPYDLLVSGAFNSNLSRQEIRVEPDSSNYNRFLLAQVARTLRESLIPALMLQGSSAEAVLRIFDRKSGLNSPSPSRAAQILYEEVRRALADFLFIPSEVDGKLAIPACALPPLVSDGELGPAFRKLLGPRASVGTHFFPTAEFCSSDIARVLADHGAYCLSPEDAAVALASSDPSRSQMEFHVSAKFLVDPVLSILERLWLGLAPSDRDRLAEAARQEPLFPVGIAETDAARRIPVADLTCFYPPRSLHGEVPLAGLCFLMQDICWGSMTPKERNLELKQQLVVWQALFDVQEFKFPAVMRASVLPALDLDHESEMKSEREALHTMERIAAICQLAGRTSNPYAPLPYERLGTTNRALFNLSRLDLPCRGRSAGEVDWLPAYKVYFGEDWIGDKSIERILKTAETIGISDLPNLSFLIAPSSFNGLLRKYQHLQHLIDTSEAEDSEIGADEVSIDEDEESAIEVDDQDRWQKFLDL